ncbi:MAG: sialate O-acetylesterase, partial [Akkermansiaceae bacterium]|nr:sialate O-acetylesterase [Akkermansiaceae bacterium]
GRPIRIWGWADPGEEVSVTLGGKSGRTTAGKEGKWRVDLEAMDGGKKKHTLTVKGKNTIKVKDVLLGEVWICSGQSNMEWSVKQSMNPAEEIAAADHPQIRLFNVPGRVQDAKPQDEARGEWQVCSPQTIPGFSAVGYYFGRELQKALDVPIGLVGTNWGGTRIEPWTPPVGFEQVPVLKDYVESIASGNPKPKGGATRIYNGMVAALTPLSVRGAIWYQGESNAKDGLRYEYLKEALVKGWRTVFENDDLSFYWVQLANFKKPTDDPAGGDWGPVREGQRRALRLPRTGMAVTIDVGQDNDIHPRNKQDVGKRLARWALAKDYGKNLVVSGPLYKSMEKDGNKIRIHFEHVGSGLMTGRKEGLAPVEETTGQDLERFAIQDAAGTWHWANARIDGETVLVWHDDVKDPQNVRFGYESNPVGINLYNKEGLPASPFTTD